MHKKQKVDENKVRPNQNIQHNKEYEEYENLTRYESIYSCNYSNNKTLNDCIKMKFKNHLSAHSLFNNSLF